MREKLAFRKSAAINADHSNSSVCRTFCKNMVALWLQSVVALNISVKHAGKAIYEQISVTLSTLQLLF